MGKNKSSQPKEIEPWGVNVLYIYLTIIAWTLGIFFLFRHDIQMHGYFMMIGAYSLYAGMVQRLFFPAKKYIGLHLATLITLAIPFSHYFQALAFSLLTVTEIWSLYDLKSYGVKLSKFPLNILVLISPPLSAISWALLNFHDFWILVPPLFSYLLGVNIGVYSATLGNKMYTGYTQVPLIAMVLATFLSKIMLPVTLVIYLGYILIKRTRKRIMISALLTLIISIIVPISAVYLGDMLHAFTLDVMIPYFMSCITYSISGYNYPKEWAIPILMAFAFYFRFISILFKASVVFGVVAVLYFIYLNKDSLGWMSMKYGMSKKYLEPYFKGKGIISSKGS